MIADRDRIAIAISGGKDSLSLLHFLDARHACSKMKQLEQEYQPVRQNLLRVGLREN